MDITERRRRQREQQANYRARKRARELNPTPPPVIPLVLTPLQELIESGKYWPK